MSITKNELRRIMKARRAAAQDRLLRDEKILHNLLSLEMFSAGKRYFVYKSFGVEADTSQLVAELLRRGKEVYLPRTCGKEMVLVRYEGQAFVQGAYGIAEPVGAASNALPDVCVLPMLAGDADCRRLGYGGGYYDRFLANQGKTALKIGICYDFQIVDKIPAEGHDVPADAIVTDARIFRRANTEE